MHPVFPVCFVCLLLLLTSCLKPLSVQTQYVGRNNLASFQVGTPDPKLDHPDKGQRLLIEWSLPKIYADADLEMVIRVRFKTRKEETETLKLKQLAGHYYHSVINERYLETGGISTYQIEILANGQRIECWHHPLWVELIQFSTSQLPLE